MNDASVREAVERIKQGPAVVSLADFAIVAHAALPLFDETPIDKRGSLASRMASHRRSSRQDYDLQARCNTIGLWNAVHG
jgi:hypothetical protein